MKKKLKGLLSLWLAVVLVLGTPTVPILAEGTEHGGHATSEWRECNDFSGDLSEKKYYLSSGGIISSSGAVVSGNTTICLNGNTFYEGGISVKNGGILTMDDCALNQGRCERTFEVESGGTLNLKRGNYVSCQESKVKDGGTLNIGDEDGGTTKVMIAYYDYSGMVLQSKITGNFNLIKPTKCYKERAGNVQVFDWYLSSEGGGAQKMTITGAKVSNVGEVKSKYSDLWRNAEDSYADVYLYSKWADGYTVTYKYNDSGDSDKKIGVVSGNTITLETPTRTDYTFKGWENNTDGSILLGGTSFIPTANTTLTAQWTKTSGGNQNNNTSSGGNPVTPPGNNNSNNSNNSNNNSNNNNNNNNNNAGTTDWNSIKSNVSNAKDGDTVNIDLSKDTTVPGDILNSIKGKDVTLVLELGNGMSWKINGNSITADKLGDINFSVNANSNAIPVEVVNKVSGERYTIQVSLAHNGPFGFEAILAVELDAKDAGLYANLFYYNPQTKELEFVGADIITDKGMAEFTFTHASDYVIVIDKVSMDPNANIPAKGTKLTDKKTKAVYKVTKSGKTGGTVEYLKSTDKKATSISIPATVTIDGITYKVTSIAANAFKNNKTVKKITIGKNVTKIGAKAFYGCTKLKSITIKTTKLTNKNVGKDVFKGIANDAKIKVPEKKLDIYKKIFAKKGLGDQAVEKK